jgi:hypothetical protein
VTELANERLRQLLSAFLDAVKEGKEHGAPAGVMYAAMMGEISLEQFESIMGALVALKCIRKQGHLYFWLADLPR